MISNCEAPIGVFDSGVGGLTVAKEIMSQIPNEKILYFGDTARVPYGRQCGTCRFPGSGGSGYGKKSPERDIRLCF